MKLKARSFAGLALLSVAPLMGTAGSGPPSLSGVCGLVTQKEASTALGKPVPVGVEKVMNVPLLGTMVKTESCFYGSEVVIGRYEFGANSEKLFNQYRESLKSQSDFQVIGAVGDNAFIAKGQLAVRKGSVALIVDVGQARGGGAKEVSAEKSLALLALSRM